MRSLLGLAASAFLGAAALAPGASVAQGVPLNIVTGGPAGTYIQFGRDISEIGAACGQTLNVRESAGSLENVFAVRDRPVTQLGIVQSDVLEYLRTFEKEDPTLRRAAEGLRIVFPLYDEEVHVLARSDIESLSELDGKRVAVGVENSGNYITAQLVLDLAEVEPAERRTDLAPTAALEALRAGEIDAMFYVVGAPAPLFAEAELGDDFHLLPMEDPVLRAVYTPATIETGTYGFLEEDVPIVAVKAVLVTFEFEARRSRYHRMSCRGVSDFTHLITSRFDELRESGHPKWREVDVTAIPPGWSVASCALEGVAPGYGFTCVAPDGSETAEGGASGEDAANSLFLARVCQRIGC